ncbi:MAG: hypothetical protein ABFS19_03915 [Thermodesulfobacteriota bacterium]
MKQTVVPLPTNGFQNEFHCTFCNTSHGLPADEAKNHARHLQATLNRERQLDYSLPVEKRTSALSTKPLFGDERGKMFGILVCLAQNGCQVILKAFSGQYGGHWLIDGWAPPLFGVESFQLLNVPKEKEIKELGTRMECLDDSDPEKEHLRVRRRQLSRQLMGEIHDLYSLCNFRGQRLPLKQVFIGRGGIPSGTGDCCAPKLLNLAAKKKLRPVSLTEFYWGRANRSATREHGAFYEPCREKCHPILGYMLCGLDEQPRPTGSSQ